MGLDTGNTASYGGYGYQYQSQYVRRTTYPPKRGGAYQQPIDLTGDSPPKKRGKRKAVVAEEEEAQPAKKKKSKPKDEEKRLKRWRPKAPISYGEIRDRALTQRMFVVDRERHAPDVCTYIT